MSLNTFWQRKAKRDFKTPIVVIAPLVHWRVTCWFIEEVGSMVEDEHRFPYGRNACEFACVEEDSHGSRIFHAREWVHDDDDRWGDELTCPKCKEMFHDL